MLKEKKLRLRVGAVGFLPAASSHAHSVLGVSSLICRVGVASLHWGIIVVEVWVGASAGAVVAVWCLWSCIVGS